MLKEIDISLVRESKIALRTIDPEDENYLGLQESFKKREQMGTITVREAGDGYEIIDGLHRYQSCKLAGLKTIKVDVLEMSDAEMIEAQIMLNFHRVETKPHEYSLGLRRLLAMNHTMTENELADILGTSTRWIKERLELTKIEDEEISGLIDDGKITLSNAYALAKLPPDEMKNFKEDAQNEPPDKFVPKVNARAKEIRDNRRKGLATQPEEYKAIPHLQKISDIKTEMNEAKKGRILLGDIKEPLEVWKFAMAWVLHLDPESQGILRAKFEGRRKKERGNEQETLTLEEKTNGE